MAENNDRDLDKDGLYRAAFMSVAARRGDARTDSVAEAKKRAMGAMTDAMVHLTSYVDEVVKDEKKAAQIKSQLRTLEQNYVWAFIGRYSRLFDGLRMKER